MANTPEQRTCLLPAKAQTQAGPVSRAGGALSWEPPHLHAVGPAVHGRAALVRTLVDGGQFLPGVFNIVPEVSEVVLISFNSFFFFPLCFIYFHHSIFHLT